MTETTAVAALRALIEKNGRRIEPEEVVQAARPESSPLHSHFEWDDSVAGELYRVTQARSLIRAVVIHRVDTHGKPTVVRAYVSVPSDPDDRAAGEVYRPIEDVAADDDLRQRFEQQLDREWKAFRAKWRAHADYLAEIVQRDLMDGAA